MTSMAATWDLRDAYHTCFREKALYSSKSLMIYEDALLEAALEAGADDMIANEDSFEIVTDPAVHTEVHHAALQMPDMRSPNLCGAGAFHGIHSYRSGRYKETGEDDRSPRR